VIRGVQSEREDQRPNYGAGVVVVVVVVDFVSGGGAGVSVVVVLLVVVVAGVPGDAGVTLLVVLCEQPTVAKAAVRRSAIRLLDLIMGGLSRNRSIVSTIPTEPMHDSLSLTESHSARWCH
jgi:hypothetical protein